MAGLFGLGGPEMIALLCIAGFGLVAVSVAISVVVLVTREKKRRSPEDED
jgi:hypothetical protein